MAQSGESISETSSLLLVLIYIGVTLLLLNKFSYIFLEGWYYIRVGQLTLLNTIPDWMPFTYLIPYDDGFRILKGVTPNSVTGEYVKEFDSYFAPYLSWIPALFVYHLYVKLNSRSRGVTSKFSMEQILQRNAKIFPWLKDYIDFNPATMKDLEYDRDDKRKLQYLPSVSPVEYALMSPPLGLEKEAEAQPSYRFPIWDGEDTFDGDLAKRAFEKQLTNHFVSFEESLTDAQRKIFLYLSVKAGHDRKHTAKVVSMLFKGIVKGKGVYAGKNSKLTYFQKKLLSRLEYLFEVHVRSSGLDSAIKRFTNSKNIRELTFKDELESIYSQVHAESLMSSHGFVVTGLMTLLEEGRGGGVIPCVEFQWLKGEDRQLWYCLHSVGRKTPFVEAAGAYDHWQLEKMVGKPITQAEVGSAVDALKVALHVDKKSMQRKKRQKEKMGF